MNYNELREQLRKRNKRRSYGSETEVELDYGELKTEFKKTQKDEDYRKGFENFYKAMNEKKRS